MDDHTEQPLPPGVLSTSYSSPLVPTLNPAGHLSQSFQKTANFCYHAGNGDGTLFPVVASVQPFSESFHTSEHVSSEAILNTLPSNLESINGLKLQPQSANDLESAAQNAVLHEQVCCTLLIGALFISSFIDLNYLFVCTGNFCTKSNTKSKVCFICLLYLTLFKLKLYKRNECFTIISLLKFREARDASGPKDNSDIFSGRHDPNALKVF